jgi:replicative DNA helicase
MPILTGPGRPLNASEIWAARKKLPVIPTFSKKLNTIFGGGFRSTGVYVCSGGPGSYKSSMALDFADAAIASGHPVVYVSAELTPQLVMARMMGKKLGMGWLEALDTEDANKIEQTNQLATQLGDYLHVLDSEQARDYAKWIPQIQAKFIDNAKIYHKETTGQDLENPHINMLVIIDYIQDLAATIATNFENQRAAVSALSRQIRSVATGLFIPVLVISSSSRAFYAAAEEQKDSSLIASAKDAGEVEYDSAAVFHLRRRDAGDDHRLEVVVAKNRFGESMQSVVFKLEPKTGLITEAAETASQFKLEIMLNEVAKALYQNPGFFTSPSQIAKQVNMKLNDVKYCLEVFGQGTYKGMKLYQGNQDGSVKGFFLGVPSV